MKVRVRKRYWLVYSPAWVIIGIFTFGLGLLLIPFAWMLDKTMARAAYKREELDLPPSWYDGWSKWEFERIG